MSDWERVAENTFRLKVFGGWVVRVYCDSTLFVPDAHHEWVL